MSAPENAFVDFEPAAPVAAPRIAFRPHRQLPWLLLPDGMPLQILIETAPVRVPNTRAWFRGVVSQRGNLLPVFDLAAWAGMPEQTDAQQNVIVIGLGAQACAMLCFEAPTLLSIDSEDPTSTEDRALSPFLGRKYASALGGACEFNIQNWLATAAREISSNAAV